LGSNQNKKLIAKRGAKVKHAAQMREKEERDKNTKKKHPQYHDNRCLCLGARNRGRKEKSCRRKSRLSQKWLQKEGVGKTMTTKTGGIFQVLEREKKKKKLHLGKTTIET